MRLTVAFLLLLLPAKAWAVSPEIFVRASSASGIPVELLLAIAHVESRFNPHAVNVSGRSFFPTSRAQAEEILKGSGRNVDVGLMQINWGIWGMEFGVSKADLLDPARNVLLGAMILSRYVRLRGDRWDGVGSYHSGNPRRQRSYIAKVRDAYRRILLRK